ncbi:mycothione reductase [Propionibacterium cyclohexanicum]|mgnify:CR=1 FL=1|uniref:Mycothione reductase n=2 Tax=Propionibacterium cyclohexanicum TaxID=64702 RepID=A0A1H9RTN2_9ACTN|nr:mycothione reductase [Propionibacterium cyclohexanicum]
MAVAAMSAWNHGHMTRDHFDLCIIGSGSGNTIIDEQFDDQAVALVDQGVGEQEWFGGTCLNVGCIPTKMLVVPADFAMAPAQAQRLGVSLHLNGVDFAAIQKRVFGRTNAISTAGLEWREKNENVTVLREPAAFLDAHRLQVGRRTISAEQFVIAAGSRPRHLDVPGLDDPDLAGLIHTYETITRVKRLPRQLVIVGGGTIAVELGHVFSAYGSRVTVVHRGPTLLRRLDGDLRAAATKLASERYSVKLNQQLSRVEPSHSGGLIVWTHDADGVQYSYTADAMLLALGNVPNGDLLAVEKAGVAVDDEGFVVTDAHQRTSQPHIWALGDVCDHHLLKHVANAQARTVQHNLLHPDDLVSTRREVIPQAIFTDPPMFVVGATQQELEAAGQPFVHVVQDFSSVAYGWALDDRTSFVKLLADPKTGRLLGAHLIGPEAPELGQLLVTAMSFGIDAQQMARGQYWAHPELAEVVENALLSIAAQCEAYRDAS